MGNSCSRRNNTGSLIPEQYQWDGVNQTGIAIYEDTKDATLSAATEQIRRLATFSDCSEGQVVELKRLLMDRAIALVKVPKPIEEERASMRKMHASGFVADQYFSSFEAADAECQQELHCILEEAQQLVPEAQPIEIIKMAVQIHLRREQMEKEQDNAEPGQAAFTALSRCFLNQPERPRAQSSTADDEEKPAAATSELSAEDSRRDFPELKRGFLNRVRDCKEQDAPTAATPPKAPPIHPDAQDLPPVLTSPIQIRLDRQRGQGLGLALKPHPELLLVTGVVDGEDAGYAKTYNESQSRPELKLMPLDHIVAVVDMSNEENKIVGGDSQAMLEVIKSGCSPLGMIVQHVSGPPLRFSVGQNVKVSSNERELRDGKIMEQWPRHPQTGQMGPAYVVQLSNGDCVLVLLDDDSCIVRGDARFQASDKVMAHVGGEYHKAVIQEVVDRKTTFAYTLEMVEGDQAGKVVNAPQDLDIFVRPPARFEEGDRVECNIGSEFVTGKIKKCYHPTWVYQVELDSGSIVNVPQDNDACCRLFDSICF